MRFEAQWLRRGLDQWMVLFTVPLFTLIFLLVFDRADRADLQGHAVLAPVLIAQWGMALFVSGEIVDRDRWSGLLELAVAAPAPLEQLLVGRILSVSLVSLFASVEAWTVAALVGVEVVVHHPAMFVAALVLTVLATSGTALIMSCTFVLARTARTFQNSLSYPFYVLGGVVVPVAVLPDWLEPFSRVVYLSWASDLLRDTLVPGPLDDPAVSLMAIAVLGLGGYLVGKWLLGRIVGRVRRMGTLTYR